MTPRQKTKRKPKLAPLPKTILIGDVLWNTESFFDGAIKDGLTAVDIAPFYNRSLASVEQALGKRKQNSLKKRDNMLIKQKVFEEAMKGNGRILTLAAENIGMGKHDALDGITLPQPLIINFPKQR